MSLQKSTTQGHFTPSAWETDRKEPMAYFHFYTKCYSQCLVNHLFCRNSHIECLTLKSKNLFSVTKWQPMNAGLTKIIHFLILHLLCRTPLSLNCTRNSPHESQLTRCTRVANLLIQLKIVHKITFTNGELITIHND